MLHRITLLERHHDLDTSTFRARWSSGHAAIVFRLPGLASYSQNHVIAARGGGRGAYAIAGIVETWYSSADNADLATSAPETFAELLEDERQLLSGSVAFAVAPTPTRHEDRRSKVWAFASNAGREALAALVEAAAGVPDLMEAKALLRNPDTPPITRQGINAPRAAVAGIAAFSFAARNHAEAALDTIDALAADAFGPTAVDRQTVLTQEVRMR